MARWAFLVAPDLLLAEKSPLQPAGEGKKKQLPAAATLQFL